MYRLKESGIGKKWCGDEVIILTKDLSQRKLKKLFNKNCEFVEYEQTTTSEETKTQGSTAKTKDTKLRSRDGRKRKGRKTDKE